MKLKNNLKLNLNYLVYSFIFIFVIINSMIPNNEKSNSIVPLKTILPGIESIYATNNIGYNVTSNSETTTFSFKIFETFKKYVIH